MSAPGWLPRLRQWLRAARGRQRVQAELLTMNALELRDLGLGRSDVPSVLAGRFDRRHAH